MNTTQSTAGRHESHPYERNDCTVVALAHAADIPYAEAHKLAASAGRRIKHGMRRDAIKTMLRNLDISGMATVRQLPLEEPVRKSVHRIATQSPWGVFRRTRRPRRTGVTVAQFIRTLPCRGRFYLNCTTHAFAYVDGVVMDNLERPLTRAVMFLAYEITPKVAQVLPVPAPAPITQAQINELWERLNKLEGK